MGSQTGAAELRLPADLTEWDQFVLWRPELRGGKKTKVPYTIHGRRASTTSPDDWAPYEAALEVWRKYRRRYAGLGFVFSEADPFTGIDLDDCLQVDGAPKAWVCGLLERFNDTYMEISPSGLGVKIWARGAIPENLPGVRVKGNEGAVEMYCRGRFFTVTGRVFRNAPLEVAEHAAHLTELYEGLARKHGSKGWTLQPARDGRISHPHQHGTLVSILGTLRRAFAHRPVCEEAIEAFMQAVNQHQCEDPGPRENIARMVRSSRGWAAR